MLNILKYFNFITNHPCFVHLVQASSLPYLSLKSKSCGCVLPDRLPYFLSPWNVFFFYIPLSIPSLSSSSHIGTHWPPHAGVRWWLFCLDTKRMRTLDLCGQWAVLILFWEHVRRPMPMAGLCLPVPKSCHLVGGLPLLRVEQSDQQELPRVPFCRTHTHSAAICCAFCSATALFYCQMMLLSLSSEQFADT